MPHRSVPSLAAAVTLLCAPAVAAAAALTDPAQLAAPVVHTGFEDVGGGPLPQPSYDTVIATAGAGVDAVIVTVTTTPVTENLYFWQNSDGWLGSWTSPSAPITITFDRSDVTAALIRVRDCTTGFTATFTGATGAQTFDGGAADCAAHGYIGADGIGAISKITLAGDARWDDLYLSTAAVSDVRADLALACPAGGVLGPTAPFGGPLALTNHGPDGATGVQIVDFPPGELGLDTAVTYDVGALAVGDSQVETLAWTAPLPDKFACGYRMVTVAYARADTPDPTAGDRLCRAVWSFDTSLAAAHENCAVHDLVDDDCDGEIDCADSDCNSYPGCHIRYADVIRGGGPFIDDQWPPPGLPLLDGSTGYPSWLDDPSYLPPQGECQGSRDGQLVTLPDYCCDLGAPPESGTVSEPDDTEYFTTCTPYDPNFMESDPHVNAQGVGRAAAGDRIRYTIHYENIGGLDAHGVQIVDPLPAAFADAELGIEDGGVLDAATHTIVWIDPVVFPNDPRTVHFTARMPTGARAGTRVRNVATIVFPDAVPPSRMDTPALEHVVPDPAVVLDPALAIVSCTRTGGGDDWTVRLANRGFGFAYDVQATIVDPPPAVTVTDGTASFSAVPSDQPPTVLPLSGADSSDTITMRAAQDPCAALTWDITYRTLAGAFTTTRVQYELDADRDGVPDLDEQPGGGGGTGCGCRSGGGEGGGGGSALVLALAALIAFGRRRQVRA